MSSYDEHLISEAGGDGDKLDQIQTRVNEATPAPWFQHQDWIDMGVPDASHTISSDPKPYGKFIASVGLQYDVKHGNANLVAHAPEDLAYLLALVREQAAKLERVEALAEDWRYKGEFGWGAWQEGHGPDPEGSALDHAAGEIRKALEPTP